MFFVSQLAATSPVWTFLSAIFLLALAAFACSRTARLPAMERYLYLALPAILLFSLDVIWDQSAANLNFNWSPVRLAPAFAIKYGEPLYPGVSEGPVSGHIYGPMAALAYLPATVCDSPTTALRVGGLIAASLFFLPVLLFFRKTMRDQDRSWLWAFWGWAWMLLLVLRSDTLLYNAFMIHAEAPALGFATAAFAVLWSRQSLTGKTLNVQYLLAALLALFSLWSKQTMLPLVVALPTYLWFAQGRSAALRFGACLAITAALTIAVFAYWFGGHRLWLNEIVIPSHHPWLRSITDTNLPWIYDGDLQARLSVLTQACLGLLRRCAKALLIIAVILIWQRFRQRSAEEKPSWKTMLTHWLRQPWGLCLWTACWLVPTSLLGRVKVGGDSNAYGPATFFVCLAAALWLIHTVRDATKGKQSFSPLIARLAVAAILSLNLLVAWFVASSANHSEQAASHSMDKALTYARSHPGQVYFPWNPLLTLMSEHKSYHFAYGVFDRDLADMPVTPEHFQSGLPADLQEVFYADGDERQLLAKRLTNFTHEVRLPELPGWVILRADQSAPAPHTSTKE